MRWWTQGGPAAVFLAASVWLSFGRVAVVTAQTQTRLVVLPGWWVLAALTITALAISRAAAWSTPRWRAALPALLIWLPYVPGRVPAAFLIWQGPIEAVVWLIVVIGLAIAHPPSWPRTVATACADARRAPWIAAMLTATTAAAMHLWLSPRLPGGDEPHYLVIAQSLWRDHDLAVDDNHARVDYASFAANEIVPHYVKRGLDGRVYSVHAPGLAALVLPAFSFVGVSGAVATVIAMSAAMSALVWIAAWRVTASAAAAWAGWAAVCATSPMVMHTITVLPDLPGALGVIAGIAVLTAFDADAATTGGVVVTSVLLGLLPWLHSRFAVLAGVLGAAIALRLAQRREWSRLIAFAVAPAVLAAGWFAMFASIWGSPSPNAPWGTFARPAWAIVARGLPGLLFDQQVGLIVHAPVYLVAAWGLTRVCRQRWRLGVELALVAVPYAVIVAAYDGWPGGFGGPARYLVAVLPVAAVAVAWLWRSGGVTERTVIGAALAWSVPPLVGRLVAASGRHALLESFGADPLVTWWMPLVAGQRALPDFKTPDAVAAAIVWAVVSMAALVLTVVVRPRRDTASRAWLRASVMTGVGLMVASTFTWTALADAGTAPAAAQAAFVHDWRPALRSLAVQWRRPYLQTADQILPDLDLPLRRVRGDDTSFEIADVPAGAFRLELAGAAIAPGALAVHVGSSDVPLVRETLAAGRRVSLPLTLAAGVGRLRVNGDAATIDSLQEAHLRVDTLADPGAPLAEAAARYGDVDLFALDRRVYLEGGGLWTSGTAPVPLRLSRPESDRAIVMDLQAGPVPVAVDLDGHGWSSHVVLAAHDRRAVEVPAVIWRSRPLMVRADTEFVPVLRDPSHRDFRHLGVFVSVR